MLVHNVYICVHSTTFYLSQYFVHVCRYLLTPVDVGMLIGIMCLNLFYFVSFYFIISYHLIILFYALIYLCHVVMSTTTQFPPGDDTIISDLLSYYGTHI